MTTIAIEAAEQIERLRNERRIGDAHVLKLFVGATVHEQHSGGPAAGESALHTELTGYEDGLALQGHGHLTWHPWVALLGPAGRKTPVAAYFPMDTGHDWRGIGRVICDKPNFFAFEHHTGFVLFTITADDFFVPTGESDWR